MRTQSTAIRIDAAIHRKVAELSHADGRSIRWHVDLAMKYYLAGRHATDPNSYSKSDGQGSVSGETSNVDQQQKAG
jgi:hypothetical protein